MQIRYRYTRASIQKAATIVLEQKLHYTDRGSGIKIMCTKVIEGVSWGYDNPNIKTICLAYDYETPIGTAIVGNIWGYNIVVYVTPQYRRKGIGSKLILMAKRISKESEFYPDAKGNSRRCFYKQLNMV